MAVKLTVETPNTAAKQDAFGLLANTPEEERMLTMYEGLTDDMTSVSREFMTGEIAPDLQRQIETLTGEKIVKGGMGTDSQAARNLVARDFGLTSLQLKEKGVQMAAATAELVQRRNEFSKTYRLSVQEHMENIRRGNLSVEQLKEERRQFDLTQNRLIMEQIAATTAFSHELAYKWAATKMEGRDAPSALYQDVRALLTDLSAQIK